MHSVYLVEYGTSLNMRKSIGKRTAKMDDLFPRWISRLTPVLKTFFYECVISYDTLMKNCFKDWSQSNGLAEQSSCYFHIIILEYANSGDIDLHVIALPCD